MDVMPSLQQVVMTLQAISPRLAINTRLMTDPPELLRSCGHCSVGSLSTGKMDGFAEEILLRILSF